MNILYITNIKGIGVKLARKGKRKCHATFPRQHHEGVISELTGKVEEAIKKMLEY